MRKLIWNLALLILLVGLLVGCRGGATILNINNANTNISDSEGNFINSEDVRKAIVSAGAGLGWVMKSTEPGHIVGTLNVRSHGAVVDIPYTTESYSILYKDSTNLKYSSSGTIHSNYNGWIQNLDRAIKAHLATL